MSTDSKNPRASARGAVKDNTQPEAGSTHIIRYALEMGLLWIDGSARDKVREALDALDTLEAQLEAIGAGGVSALMGAAKAGSEPVAWAIFAEGGNIRLWSKKPLLHPSAQPLYTHQSPPDGMAGWISVDARLPEPNTPVLLDIGKMFPLRALWAGKHMVSVGTDVDDWGEYDEETDEYYCPEGWYEWNEHKKVHWAVSETPRAWRELPPPLPAAPGPADGESNG